ncbi:MAG: DUF2911 domain-containing protein [Saprospiraceae bacterium]|nr:DUF2911 domain-containing protein [Saprospiraceae bacterium]
MNKITTWILCICAFGFIPAFGQINTPAASPSATISQVVGLSKVTLEYSRPALKGRQMIGGPLVPFNTVWRTGANKIPNITISEPMDFEGKSVPAGTYGLVTIPGVSTWTIILTKKPNEWGVYNYKPEDDLLRFEVKSGSLAEPEEYFSFEITGFDRNSALIRMTWEMTEVKFKISHNPEAQIMKEIAEKTSAAEVTADTYYDAANYYYENGKDLNKAYEWANRLVEKNKEYWAYYVRAKIAVKLGDCDQAISDSTYGLKLANEAKDNAYVLNHKNILKECMRKNK